MNCKYLDHQINVATNGQYRLCCMSEEPDNKETIHTHTPKQWHESEFHKKTRTQMANEEWPDACIRCKSMEEKGLESLRTKPTWTTYGPGLNHFDLRLGNSCNLKCISCWPGISSSLGEEAKEMEQQGIVPLHSVPKEINVNWFDDTTSKKILEYEPIAEIYFTGGEPMMVKHMDSFLEKLDKNTMIRFNTNCTLWNPKIEKLLRKFKTVSMSLSLDATDKRIDYIRYGSNWNIIKENAKRYADFCYVDISPTISVLNAHFLNEIYEYGDRNSWKVYPNLLMFPDWLHVRHAPKELKKLYTHKFVKQWADVPADNNVQELFKKNISKLDSFRKNNIKDYLPEVAKAYSIS